MLGRLVGSHLLDCPALDQSSGHTLVNADNIRLEAGLDMTISQCLKHENKDFFDRIAHPVSICARISRKGFCALERVAVCVNEFESDVQGQQEV